MHVTPHPLVCVPLQPLDKPPFFPSFHPATNTVTTLLTYKKTAIHPTLPGKNVLFLPNQLKAQSTGSGYIHLLSAAAAPRTHCPAFLAIHTRTDRWNMLLRLCAGCRVTDSHVLLPSSLPRSPCPPRY